MTIQTLGERYHVIKYSYSDDNRECFVCQRESDTEKYAIVCIKNKLWISDTILFLMEQMQNDHFTDFVSCFMSEACLYVVMKYTEGISLKEKLETQVCSFEEHMAIGKGILDKIMLSDMPDYFLWDCLTERTIILQHGLTVGFQYELRNLYSYQNVRFSEVQTSLCAIFGVLFSEERKARILPPLEEFYNALAKNRYRTIMEIYTAYDKMCKEAKIMGIKERAVPQTWEFRAWEKVKRLIPMIKKIIASVFMLLAVIFLLYEIREAFSEGSEQKIFESVGTLDIKPLNEE